ncbi:MAG: DUF1214 domain-containing protein [Lachnospiraceae bacterium]
MEQKLVDIAKEFYIQAYPIVWTSEMTRGPREHFLNLYHYRTLVKAETKMYKPNNDTLYSTLTFQLKNSPYIVHVPKITDRYVLVNSFNTKTDVYFSTGSKDENYGAGDYIFLYQDTPVPDGYESYTVVRSEDSRNILMLRIENFGEDDLPKANAYQDQFEVYPLYPQKIQSTGEHVMDQFIDYIEHLPAERFVQAFLDALEDTKIDPKTVELLHQLGIQEQAFDPKTLEDETKQILKQGFAKAYEEIKTYDGPEGTHSNGWYSVTKDVGTYGKKYLLRAFVTWFAYGANLPEDSIYPVLYKDSDGDTLNSEKEYVIHFEKDGLPHAKFFWSISWYSEPDGFVADNKLDRYTLNSHAQSTFHFNEDGSLDLYISQNPPKEETLVANWLPAAKEATDFSLLMRIYGADEQTLNGEWEFPTVKKVK